MALGVRNMSIQDDVVIPREFFGRLVDFIDQVTVVTACELLLEVARLDEHHWQLGLPSRFARELYARLWTLREASVRIAADLRSLQ